MQHSTQPPTDTGQEDEAYTVSAILRATREASDESLEDVARQLRISRKYLEALEEGRFSELPGNTYTLGFIRTYADHLGLGGTDLVNRYKAANGSSVDETMFYFPEPLPESGIPGGTILFAGIFVAMLAYGVWYVATEKDSSLANLVSPVPDRLAEMISTDSNPDLPDQPTISDPVENEIVVEQAEVGVIASKPVVEGVETELAAIPEEPQTDPDVVEDAIEPVETVEIPEIAATPESEPEISEDVIVEEVQQIAASGPEPEDIIETVEEPIIKIEETSVTVEPEPPEPRVYGKKAGSRILITATANSWAEVRDTVSGELLLTRLLRTGDRFHVPNRPGITLETGNAGGLEILVDGRVVPPIGGTGAVRHGVALDPERLKSGTATE